MEKVESLVWEIAQTNLTAINALPLDRAFLPWRSHENSSLLRQSPNGKRELTRLFTACGDLLPSASRKFFFIFEFLLNNKLRPKPLSQIALETSNCIHHENVVECPIPQPCFDLRIALVQQSSNNTVTDGTTVLAFDPPQQRLLDFRPPASQHLATPEPQQHSTPHTAPRPKRQRKLQHEPNPKPPWKTASL